MIVVRLTGGLGNQMFQYALGRSLASAHRTDLLLDLAAYDTDHLRQYELHHFNIQSGIIARREADKFTFRPVTPIHKSIRAIRQTVRPRHVVLEPHYWYWPAVEAVKNDSYLIGYWQSWKYFASISNMIREDFTPGLQLDAKGATLQESIASVNSVCLHVRRSDYITDTGAQATLGVCGLDYFEKAIARMAMKVPNPHFFVFSDDTAWCEQNITARLAQFPHTLMGKEYAEGTSVAHFQLMTSCKYFVVANSTFSWWAAWLGNHDGKIVIAPQRPFVSPLMDAKDFYPADWLRA